MNETNPVLMQEIMGLMETNRIVQSILGIPMIEIEQLNSRCRSINGIMKVNYTKMSADIRDPDGAVSYEYDWVGGEMEFVPNPYPRPPLGTGKIAFIADDSMDPQGKPVALPKDAMSGLETGWNREFLASHYGECYWRIVDPKIDAEIRERYRCILINRGVSREDAERSVEEAVKKQGIGSMGSQKVIVSRSSEPVTRAVMVKPQPSTGEIENHPLFAAIRRENEELREAMKKFMESKTGESGCAEQPGPGGSPVFCAGKGKDGKPCKAFAKKGEKYCLRHIPKAAAVAAAEPAGNLGG